MSQDPPNPEIYAGKGTKRGFSKKALARIEKKMFEVPVLAI